MIIFIPFQRFLYFLLFNNPPKDDLLRGEIISIRTKNYTPRQKQSSTTSLFQLFHLFSKKILLTMHHDNGQFRNVVDTNVADRRVEQKFVSSMMKRSSATLSNLPKTWKSWLEVTGALTGLLLSR